MPRPKLIPAIGLCILLLSPVARAQRQVSGRLEEGDIRPRAEKYDFQEAFTEAEGISLYDVQGWDNDVTCADGLDPSPDDNILYNGGFEAAVENRGLAGWRVEFVDGAQGKVEWDQAYSRSGKGSLKITKENSLGYIIVYSTKSLPCQKRRQAGLSGILSHS